MRRPVFPAILYLVPVWGLAALLAGCSSASSVAPPGGPASRPPASPARTASPTGAAGSPRSTATAWSFTVAGANPVAPNDSQATRAQAPDTSCSGLSLAADQALGGSVADGFAGSGYPVAAALLRHFLAGSGTAVGYPATSAIAKQARASSAFQAVQRQVQAAVLAQLRTGRHSVELTAAQLPAAAFENNKTDLYWGFRGTQGLSVTGHGTRAGGRYAGTLTYTIRDSYGFPAGDTLSGVGTRMRYLQTVCGAPQQSGGARWFPDTIAVTVPFSGSAA